MTALVSRPPARRLLLGLALTAGLALAGCGGDDGGASASGASERAGGEHYPVTIDNCGKPLTFSEAPSRAVLSWQPIAEMFVGLGLGDRAVGQVAPVIPPLPEQAQAFAAIPDVSRTYYPPPREEMLGLRPDFLLAYGDFDYSKKTGLATPAQLERIGAQVYSVECPGKGGHANDSLAIVYRSILDLGTIFDLRDEARTRVAEMKRQIAEVRAKVRDEPPVKVLYYVAEGATGKGPISTHGGGGIVNEMITAAGGENVLADADEGFFEVSREEIAARRPDAYVIIADASPGGPPTAKLDASKPTAFLYRTFPRLPASRDRRFFLTTYVATGPGWRIAQTIEDLARALHPEAF